MSNRHLFLEMQSEQWEQEKRGQRREHAQNLLYLELQNHKNKINSDGRKENNGRSSIQSGQSKQP
jgi:hypothetical protein